MQWVVDLFNMILAGFQYIVDFFTEDIFELLRQFGEYVYSFLEMCFYDALHYCCVILRLLLDTLFGSVDFSAQVISSWGNLSPEVRQAAVFFRIPQILVIYASALTLRVVRMLIPFF